MNDLIDRNLPSEETHDKRTETRACDLIDRQSVIDALAKFVPYAICDESTESYTNGLTDAYNLILQLPSVQPEIIYCKECSRYSNGYCHHPETYGMYVDANHFCGYAERREDDE